MAIEQRSNISAISPDQPLSLHFEKFQIDLRSSDYQSFFSFRIFNYGNFF